MRMEMQSRIIISGMKMETSIHPPQVLFQLADVDVGDIWTVRVTPNDGYVDGTFSEVAITISNSIPTVSSPVISSNGGMYNDSVLTCSATASDVDEIVTPTIVGM